MLDAWLNTNSERDTNTLGKESMGVIKAALGDGILTFMWVFVSSAFGIMTTIVASTFDVVDYGATLVITTLIFGSFLFVFGLIGSALGGACFSPTDIVAFYAAGLGSDSLISAAVRMPAQAAGAVGGVLAIMEFMPKQYKHMLGGPTLQVDLHTGALAETVLTFIVNFVVLVVVLRGPQSPIVKNFLIATAVVTLVVTGSQYTGPSMNPANAFGWAYINNKHATWEQLYVYWICPLIGATLAAWTYRYIFPSAKKGRKGKGRRGKAKKA